MKRGTIFYFENEYATICEYVLIFMHPKMYKIDENARKRPQPILKNLLFMGKIRVLQCLLYGEERILLIFYSLSRTAHLKNTPICGNTA